MPANREISGDGGNRTHARFLSTSGPRVYFAKSAEPGGRGPVKIGYTADLKQRIKNIQPGNPYRLELLADMPGLRHHERLLHKRFEAGRWEDCEWFDPDTPGLQEFINSAFAYIEHYEIASPEARALIDAFYDEAHDLPISKRERQAILQWRARYAAAGIEAA